MHKSVLLNECLEYLNLSDSSVVVDCTLGYGGHSSNILKEIKRGFLFAFDQDDDAIKYSKERLKSVSDNFEIIRSNFVNLKEELSIRGIDKVNGILYDLGVSSPQLDEGERGFSFHQDARLDMRMDMSSDFDAFKLINTYDYKDLVRIFTIYGEEKFASSIARHIVSYRENKNIETTLELVEIIKNAVPIKYRREKHPARRVFQAIRIEVNKELDVFTKSLTDALDLIDIGGRICVITFHSLEDKICANIFKSVSTVDKSLSKMPIIPSEYLPKFRIVANIKPSDSEIDSNPRSRSAKLRVIERVR